MQWPPGRPAGMAILRVEIDADAEGRRLIRVVTVDDVATAGEPGPGTPFSDPEAALAHLRRWLEAWPGDR